MPTAPEVQSVSLVNSVYLAVVVTNYVVPIASVTDGQLFNLLHGLR